MPRCLRSVAPSGPNNELALGCGAEWNGFGWSLAGAITGRWALYYMASEIAAGIAVSTTAMALTVAGAVIGVGALAVGVGYLLHCVYKIEPSPLGLSLDAGPRELRFAEVVR